jgi:hypothetical protein
MGRKRLRISEHEVLRITRPKIKEMTGGNSAMRSFITCIPRQILLE